MKGSYIEVNFCMVVGLHRPHDFEPGLKEERYTQVKGYCS